ncbi:MAG: bifunctional methylenetetrahydrofolate dehydrogenase/methenyltetrahydrofolate cyclohydrolase FolD [Clostridia bacterium]|nr:bifunctional methylenetetrahydrofolate dehydrogenase/methenyltetrahydrofolate cyclohydrolase FolD [Clostridia bacterium]
MAEIISGKIISAAVKERIATEVNELKAKGVTPGLAVIIVGTDPASQVYVGSKERTCIELGMYSEKYELPENTTNEELLALVEKLNNDDKIHGILCQLPLPKHLDEKAVIDAILPEKDVDAFHVQNVGKIMLGDYDFLPCTPAGIMEMLKYSDIDPQGKHCVVIGRSNIVGKPMAMLMLHANATVTICHSRTQNLKEICREADILVASVGKAKFVTPDMVKDGAVVIDVGINRDENGKLCGDVDYDAVAPKCSAITPVPGGVGPMTIAMLMQNTLTSAKRTLK